jgi:hypothetical protein
LDPKIASPSTKNHTQKINSHKNLKDRGGNLGSDNTHPPQIKNKKSINTNNLKKAKKKNTKT